jgi:hypothetical protein
MRRLVCRTIHRTAHRIDRLGWWLADPAEHRRNRRLKAAHNDGDVCAEDGP